MPQHVKVPLFVPIVLFLPAVFLLVAPSFISFGLEPVMLYCFGGAYLVCSATYFLLKEQPWLLPPVLLSGVVVPLLELGRQARKAKQK